MVKKIKAKTDNSGWVEPKRKVRKKRKPMTEEQRQAAAERLKRAREARAAKNPEYGKSGIHSSLHNLSDDAPINPKKVKKWIKTQKELASAERRNHKSGVKGALAKMYVHEGYVKHMNTYLRTGDWVDSFYGEHQEKRIQYRCVAQAYYGQGAKAGQPKFNVGTYYPMLGTVYSHADNGVENADVQETKRRRKRNKRTVEDKTKKRGSAT